MYEKLIIILLCFYLAFPAGLAMSHRTETHMMESSQGTVSYSAHIRPLFKKRCAKCHGENSPVHLEFIKDIKGYTKQMKGPRMDTYTHLTSFITWPDTGSLMRALDDGQNTQSGKPGKMYKNLGRTDEERQNNLMLFKDWVGHWTLKTWSEIGKEDINKMKLAY